MNNPIKIAVTGTHSTGKSTFLNEVDGQLAPSSLRIGRISDLARRASELGFPILRNHTFESTLWIMTEALRQEMELGLNRDVILIDRPLIDALGYLDAALKETGRALDPDQRNFLLNLARYNAGLCDVLVMTELDLSIPLGDGRDSDESFRRRAADAIEHLVTEFKLPVLRLNGNNRDKCLSNIFSLVKARFGDIN